VAYAVLRNSHDAEDVVQEVFMKLYRSGVWHDMSDEKAYLARTAWRTAVDHLPKQKQSEMDVGVNVDCSRAQEVNSKLAVQITADISSTTKAIDPSAPSYSTEPLVSKRAGAHRKADHYSFLR
jgi:DNA-directed RNA polymerase specialized sigma24 family protein